MKFGFFKNGDLTAEQTEKRRIVQTAFIVGLCFLAAVIIIAYASKLFGFIEEFIPKSIIDYDGKLVTKSVEDAIFSIVGIGVLAFVFSRIDGFKLTKRGDFSKPNRLFGLVFMSGITVIPFANKFSDLLDLLFSKLGFTPTSGTVGELPVTALGISVWFVSTAVVPAVCEEILCRGFVYNALSVYGQKTALFVSSFLFALLHVSLVQAPFAFLMGMVLCYAMILTESIYTSMLIHFFNNALACVLALATRNMSGGVANKTVLLVEAIVFVVGLVGCVILKAENKFKKITDECGLVTKPSKRFLCIIASPTLLLAIIWFVTLGVFDLK